MTNTSQNIDSRIAEYEYTIEKLQEMGQVGIWRYDFQKQEILWSREILQIFGIAEDARFTYKNFLNSVHEDDRDAVIQNWASEIPAGNFDITHRIVADGTLKWIRHKVELDYDNREHVESVCGFVQDVSDLKYLEEKTIRSAQLAAVGEFTTMIAHEVNNPLSGIINYAQVFKVKACKDCERIELLSRIMGEGERIAKVVKNLLAFSYHSDGEKTAQKIENILLHVLGLMAPKFEENQISVKMEINEDASGVYCNAQQIEQVVLNILRNANQALSTGSLSGQTERLIWIRTQEKRIGNEPYVELRIANNGPNIPPQLIERIREPYYTTKPAGIGTGLGLSISGDILNAHNGYFDIESNPGQFTEMIISLPAAKI